jgi:hypothetical protein
MKTINMLRSGPGLVLSLLLLVLTTACGPASGGERTVPVVIPPEAQAELARGPLVFRGAVEVGSLGGRVGGLSGLVVLDEGARFVAVSDVGRIVTGRPAYDAERRLVGIDDLAVRPLADADGRPVEGRRRDAEALTRLPDGRWVVGFERAHRIETYPPAPDGPGRPAGTAMVPPGADGLPANSGLETVTVLSDGRLLALAEGPDNGRPERDGWIGGPDGWARFTYLAAPGYRPTDATVLPGGDVIVLERYFSLFGGLAGRVVRVPAAALAEGARVSGTLLRELTPPLPVSNYEGIAAVRTADGETLVFVLGDDNFSNAITTYLIVFALRP